MRTAAIILNIALLILSCVVVFRYSVIVDISLLTLFMALTLITPAITLISLVFYKAPTWLSLYFQRKAKEEQKRITALERDRDAWLLLGRGAKRVVEPLLALIVNSHILRPQS
jgi:hypothetical protein